MGQKVHPYGFRLGIQTRHQANWFALKKEYYLHFCEDLYIRKYFQENFQNAGILKIHI